MHLLGHPHLISQQLGVVSDMSLDISAVYCVLCMLRHPLCAAPSAMSLSCALYPGSSPRCSTSSCIGLFSRYRSLHAAVTQVPLNLLLILLHLQLNLHSLFSTHTSEPYGQARHGKNSIATWSWDYICSQKICKTLSSSQIPQHTSLRPG